MQVSQNYGTHLGALIKVMSLTSGDVLELGTGVFSTPYLHYACLLAKRHLVSYDNDARWMHWVDYYKGPYHEIKYVKKWEDADIEKPWDMVLVDHTPSIRRKEDIKRIANLAKYIIIHDSSETYHDTYAYHEIYPLFKYRKDWTFDHRPATVLSNFVDLEDLW